MPCSSRGQSQSGQRGGSSYTSTVRSQYGQSPSRIAGGCSVSFGIGIALGGSGLLPASAGRSPTLNQADGLPDEGTARILRPTLRPKGSSPCKRVALGIAIALLAGAGSASAGVPPPQPQTVLQALTQADLSCRLSVRPDAVHLLGDSITIDNA